MPDSKNSREASATIRGYIYQFDAAILGIINSKQGGVCTVEGIEDFDLHSDNLAEYYQCKYYASQKLTPATFRDATLPMLTHFLKLPPEQRSNNKYYLYGYFKESCERLKINCDFFKQALVRHEQIENDEGKKTRKKIDLQQELGASDEDLRQFLEKFNLHISEEYEAHREKVTKNVASAFQVSVEEAKQYHYPSALALVSTLACNPTDEGRTISRRDFFQEVRPRKALYNCWALREKTQAAYCRDMRSRYFSERNIDPDARFFILDIPEGTAGSEIKELVLHIRNKWSSHATRRKPNMERYAPYIYLKSALPDQILNLKVSLHQEGCVFVDGYPFQGADFCHETINQGQTYENKLSLRFCNTEENLRDCLNQLTQRKKVMQFFIDEPVKLDGDYTQICIPVTSTQMILNIV